MASGPPIDGFSVLPAHGSSMQATTRTSLRAFAGKVTVIHLFTGWGGCWPCGQQMEAWAQALGDKANFICMGCQGRGQAVMMRDEMRMATCTVAFADGQKDMPKWGQLGCNGFIVLDQALRVACPATSAFNMMGQLAFKHVETLVQQLSRGLPVPTACPGQLVRLSGLVKAAELNGQAGICLEATGAPDARVQVQVLKAKRIFSLKPANLRAVAAAELSPEEEELAYADTTTSAAGGWHSEGGCDDSAQPSSSSSSSSSSCSSSSSSCKPSEVQEAEEAEEEEEEAEPLSLGKLESVMVPEMDHEHDECVAALNALGRLRSRGSLQGVLNVLVTHFEHEETLLDTHLYKLGPGSKSQEGTSSAFSMLSSQRKTHMADHAAMLRGIRQELSAGDCEAVSAVYIRGLLMDFQTHAELYDSYGPDLQGIVV